MRIKQILLSIILALFCASIPAQASNNVDFGISVGNEGLRGFYLSVGNYYRVPERQVIVVRERGLPYDEVPVVFFVANRARVAPGVILDLRLRGMSWWDISVRYGIGPEVYYVPTTVVVKSPPYGKAYGYYKKYPRNQWNRIVLADADIVNLVNLRYVSEHYGYAPEKVIKMRQRGDHIVVIDRAVDREMKGKHRYAHGEGGKGKQDKHEAKQEKKDKGKGDDRYYRDDDRGKGGKSKDKHWINDIDRGKGGKSESKDWKNDPGKGKGKGKGWDD